MTSTALRSSMVTRPTPTTESPGTKKSAVFEHACLFTHDIRRKNTKRWQDGYLRFHQFNSRVMVYDQSRNYIGDTHFRSSSQAGLEDGDELQLERGGVLVQVAERLSVVETDLTDLLAKRAPKLPNSPPRTSTHAAISNTTKIGSSAARAQAPNHSPFELNRTIGTSSNPYRPVGNSRPVKRSGNDDEHIPLQKLLKGSKATTSHLSSRNAVKSAASNGQISVPNSPSQLRAGNYHMSTETRTPHRGGVFNSSSPLAGANPSPKPKQTRSAAQLKRREQHQESLQPPESSNRAPSPPVSTTNHVVIEAEPNDPQISSGEKADATPPNSNEQKKRKRPLRLATTAPRRKLLCHTLGAGVAKTRQKENISPPVEPVNLPETIHETIDKPDTDGPNLSSMFEEDYSSILNQIPPEVFNEQSAPGIPSANNNTSNQQDSKIHRPFRRHTSDTSPTKPAQNPPPALKRAETISVPQEKEKQKQKVTPREPLRQIVEVKVEESGSWTREAWDLFGWCPEGRAESLEWRYFEP